MKTIIRGAALCLTAFLVAGCAGMHIQDLLSSAGPASDEQALSPAQDSTPVNAVANEPKDPYQAIRKQKSSNRWSDAKPPRLNVTMSCRGAAVLDGGVQGKAAVRHCLNFEQKARAELVKHWSEYRRVDRHKCVRNVRAFSPSYTELIACLEMAKAVEKLKLNSL